MFPRHFRWISGLGVIAAVVVFVVSGLRIWSGMAPTTDLIQPIVMTIFLSWMFTQSTKA
jgi:hypothetical protein